MGEGTLLVPVSERDHIQGPFDAHLTLLEYGDYECPYCGEAHRVVKAIQEALGDELRFVFRNFPLTDMHPHAENAAEAAEAAGNQGHFWEMHDLLYEHQDALDDYSLASYADALNLDVEQLMRDILTSLHSPRIREDFTGGVRSGVDGTPTFFMNGVRYDGPLDPETMIDALHHIGRVAH